MIDIHSHILPEVDDGAQTIEESIEIAEAALAEGIDSIVATPHHLNGEHTNHKEDIIKRVKKLNQAFKRRDIHVKVIPGQQTRIYGEMGEDLLNNEMLTINDNKKYVLLDLPKDHVPHYTTNLIFSMQLEGYRPIIAHPERHPEIQQNPQLLYTLVKNGAYTQVTAASLCGKYGRAVKKLSMQLIEANLVHVIASDVHEVTKKGLYMKQAFTTIEKHFGQAVTYALMDNAHYIIEGEELYSEPPEHPKRKKVFSIL
ncbi:tyrosine protein phosphatase [Halobacillus andaensis]|uniref:Tyrosine-protein phosphatase n=1 Tax=Halobacillus andaensis TaxID=1176239 RepID=A0A917EWN3_HALAA|nr:CpsB/CapC family capsule biosynthesis tyrosine phosphatase [Halobacillus andaensis]MBP2004315.1 protein-tyrosine phosphatase [Halobacillus andaensis]GGF22568.1 tyrosine protein phosphatase [Halobacillus andaensis]